jgi:hypothetical protein
MLWYRNFQVKTFAKNFVLVLIGLIVAEQVLLRYLDYLAKWRDQEFKSYLENPGPRRKLRTAYDCQYRPIAIIYRYRICIRSVGEIKDATGAKRKSLTLTVIGVKGFFSPFSEEHGDRVTWDRQSIWELDDKLNVIYDIRKGFL